MTFEELQAANKLIQTTDIKGKEYAEVNQRIKAFRSVYPDGSIDTQLLKDEDGICIVQAKVYNGDNLLGSGLAYEKENGSFINKTSYIENCETSAVGRALGMCGFGIDTSICFAEELQNAMLNQQPKQPNQKPKQQAKQPTQPPKSQPMKTEWKMDDIKVKAIESLTKRKGFTLKSVLKKYGVSNLTELSLEQFKDVSDNLYKLPDKEVPEEPPKQVYNFDELIEEGM